MKKLFSLCFLVLVGLELNAQINHLARYEIPHDWNNDDYIVVSKEEQGALIIEPVIQSGLKDYPIIFHHLNNDLKLDWTDTLDVKRQLFLKGYHYAQKKTYLLFQNTSVSREIKLVVIDQETRKMEAFEPRSIVDLEIQEFEVLRNTAIIGGYIDERPAVFAYDIDNQKVRTLSNVYQNNSELLEVRINADSVTFNVLSSKNDSKKDRTININTYDFGGNAVRDYEIETIRDHHLLNAISSSIYNKEQIVIGLYAIKAGTFPSGIFINHVDRTGQQSMKYVSFGEFDTFLDHNGERRAEKLKKRALKARQESKDWRYKTDGLFRELIETPEGLIMVGEFFKPLSMNTQSYMRNQTGLSPHFRNSFPTRNLSTNDPNLMNYNQSARQINWDFTHAFAIMVDRKGNLVWDRSATIDESKEDVLDNFGAFQIKGSQVYYALYHKEELRLSNLNDLDKEPSVEPLVLMEPGDKVNFTKEGYQGVTRWYDNRFLVYGVQTIKPGNTNAKNRRVFFVNSIKALATTED